MKGSHNTLTYARPLKWWGWLLLPIWRCQSKNIGRQINDGATAFDIRMAWDKKTQRWHGAHGPVLLDVDAFEAIKIINQRRPGSFVRIILETGTQEDCMRFAEICALAEVVFPQTTFFGGNYKQGWKQIHTFKHTPGRDSDQNIIQHVGSMKSRWGKVFPWLWSVLNRKNTPAEYRRQSSPIVFTDFIW